MLVKQDGIRHMTRDMGNEQPAAMHELRKRIVESAGESTSQQREITVGESVAPWACLLAGSALLGMGLARRSMPGLLIAAGGGCLAYRGWKGLCASVSERRGFVDVPRRGDVQDKVDEAGWESFPASDAPSYNPTAG
jgi:hypothetical protein